MTHLRKRNRCTPAATPALAAALLIVPAGLAQHGPRAGRVLDANGRPVAGVAIGSMWAIDRRPQMAMDMTATDAEGRFRIAVPIMPHLLAFDAARKHGALVIGVKGDDGKYGAMEDLTIRLQKAAPVKLRVDRSELPLPDAVRSATLKAADSPFSLATVILHDGVATLPLRPGRYRFEIGGEMVETAKIEFEVSPEAEAVEVGPLALAPSKIARLIGRAAPEWSLTDIRGLPEGTKLKDLRGKWVVLDFWGYWCKPCVRFSLPRWKRFYETYEDRRGRFEIVAIHANQTGETTLAEVDEKSASIRETYRGGEPLPFPVAVDGDGETVAAYNVKSYPTTILIDPQGRLVTLESGASPTHESDIERRLREALEASTAKGD